MKVDGKCHCGAIAFEAEVNPEAALVCHCTDCQTLSGSAFRTVVPTLPGSFRLLSGAPKVYVRTGDSGNRREQAFCADCGTPVYSAPVGGPEPRVRGLRIGVLTQRDALTPRLQIWARSARHWLDDLSRVAAMDTQPASGPVGQIGGSEES